MSNNDVLRRAIRFALFANVAATAGISMASAADVGPAAPGASTPTADQGALSEVIVTGTRIQSPALESISPVTVVTAEQIKQQGVTRIEDLLNTLPQVFGDQGGGREQRRHRRIDGQLEKPGRPAHVGSHQRPPSPARRSDHARHVGSRPQ